MSKITAENNRVLACSYLTAGRVNVFTAKRCKNEGAPIFIRAHVFGWSGKKYFVRHTNDQWLCDCEAPQDCTHITAVQIVTGHAPDIRKEK